MSVENPAADRSDRGAGLAFAAVAVITTLAYARSFASPFQFDDHGQIVGNPVLAEPSLDRLLAYARARLLPFATLALNYRTAGEEPFAYHLVNFAVHLLAIFAVFHLALALCRTPRLRESWLAGEAVAFATAAALIFACHPIQVQAVTYVVQRTAALAALFYVGCVLLYVRARNAQLGLGPGNHRLAYALSAALMRFFSLVNLHRRAPNDKTRHAEERIQHTIQLMHQNLAAPRTLQQWARSAGLSVPHFCATFRRQTGCAPMRFHARLRLQKACQLLDHTDLPVNEIAREVGYDDPLYFTRQFKLTVGMPPSQYRRAMKG